MASNHTEHFSLNQWLPNDQVVHTDFNEDNAKIDAALSHRNCKYFVTSYVGDGKGTMTLTFPGKPVFITIHGPGIILTLIRGATAAYSLYSTLAQRNPGIVWTENGVTFSLADPGACIYIANNEGLTYHLFSILDLSV